MMENPLQAQRLQGFLRFHCGKVCGQCGKLMYTDHRKMGDKIKLCKLVFWDDTFRRGGAYSGAEEVGRMVFAYLFWVGLTVLAAVALGRLKR